MGVLKKDPVPPKKHGFDIDVYCFDANRRLVGRLKSENISAQVMDANDLFTYKSVEGEAIDAVVQAKGVDVAGRIDVTFVCYTNNSLV